MGTQQLQEKPRHALGTIIRSQLSVQLRTFVLPVIRRSSVSFRASILHDLTLKQQRLKAMFEGYTDSEEVDHAPILNSFSVGFRPVDTDGNTYTKSELLEISAVNSTS